MEWTHVAGNHSTMLAEQWVLRWNNKSICTLRKASPHEWLALLLSPSGIGTTTLHINGGNLDTAKRDCITELQLAGWPLPDTTNDN